LIDMRYHIYSLAAVFFALAVGIVIGAGFARGTSSSEAERRTLSRYSNAMTMLKREIELASSDAAQKAKVARDSEEFCRAVLPMVAKNRLMWRNVAIVRTGDYDDLVGPVKRALELAGAKVVSITEIDRSFDFSNPKKVAKALTLCGIVPPADSREVREKLYRVLANSVINGGYSQFPAKLEAAKVATFTGDYSRPVKLVVLVGGAVSPESDTAESVDSPLISQLGQPSVTVVGCESRIAGVSYVEKWEKMGIASVDNADSAIGQVALLFALTGENAKFGVKKTADRLLPQTLETE
jgi:hypothetical protein